jgi:uncharacterized protein (DUF2252 family)
MKPWMTFFLGVIAAVAGTSLANHLNIHPTTIIPLIIGNNNEVNIRSEAPSSEPLQPSTDKERGKERASADSKEQSRKGSEEAKPTPTPTDGMSKQIDEKKIEQNGTTLAKSQAKSSSLSQNTRYRNARYNKDGQYYDAAYTRPSVPRSRRGCRMPSIGEYIIGPDGKTYQVTGRQGNVLEVYEVENQ